MQKQTIFMITVAILLTATASIILYNVKAANAQGNMSSASTNMTKANMTRLVGMRITQIVSLCIDWLPLRSTQVDDVIDV